MDLYVLGSVHRIIVNNYSELYETISQQLLGNSRKGLKTPQKILSKTSGKFSENRRVFIL